MDLNRKYSDHQEQVLLASAAPAGTVRETHLGHATEIAGQIATYQARLGAAAACAWSATQRKGAARAARAA